MLSTAVRFCFHRDRHPFEETERELYFRLGHSFVRLGFCASVSHLLEHPSVCVWRFNCSASSSVSHLLEHPSDRLRRSFLRKAFAFRRNISVQTTFLTAYRFRCHTISFLVVSSAELCLLHHDTRLFLIFLVPAIVTNTPLSPYTRICSMKRRSIAD